MKVLTSTWRKNRNRSELDFRGSIYALLIFCLFFVAIAPLSASSQIKVNSAFVVELNVGEKALRVLPVGKAMEVKLPDGSIVNLSEYDIQKATAEIKSRISKSHIVKSIEYLDSGSLINIAVLGDINNPAKYLVPVDSSLNHLNAYYSIYDDEDYNADFTVIRKGQHSRVASQNISAWRLNPDDAVLITLVKKVSNSPTSQQTVNKSDKKKNHNVSVSSRSNVPKVTNKVAPKSIVNVEAGAEVAKKSDIDKAVLENRAVGESVSQDNLLSADIDDQKPYLLQSGDILVIRLPEESGFDQAFLVDRVGNINLPEVGEVNVDGMTIADAREKIKKELSVFFLGLSNLNIYLKEKKILVTVLGYVEKPGEVVLPSTGNIQMAINKAGGFREGAMLNKIKLKRENSDQTIDFRTYLNTGDDQYLSRLQSLDTIFVPSSPELGNIYGQSAQDAEIDPTQDRNAIKIIGEVIKPGSIAFKENMTAVDALLLAGGVTRYADDEKIRVINDGKPGSFSLAEFMAFGQRGEKKYLSKGATIYVPIKDESAVLADDPTDNPESIKVFGEVAKPGVHKFKENISLVDILLLSGGVTRYANVEQIRLIAKGDPVLFNLKSFLDNGRALPIIEPGSTIFVPKQVDAISSGESVVYIMGQVHKPGAFETGDDVSFMDVLANAGGPTRFADASSIRVLRKTGQVLKFNLDEYSEGRIQELPEVFKGDSILVPKKAGEDQGWLKFKSDQTVKIVGAINKPGRYPWSANIDFMDLFAYAGGGNENADIAHIKFIYPEINGSNNEVKNFNLQAFMDNGSQASELPELVGGLTIVVPELPKSPTDNKSRWVLLSKEQAIYILGAVNRPGRYAFNERLDLLDLLTAADGPTPDADLSNIRIVHRNEGQERLSSVNLIKYFATGDESLLPKIKPGDGIYINSRDASMMGKDETITVLGDVKNTGRFIYRSEITIVDLISEAGGTKADADIENVIIKRGDQQIEFDLEGYMNSPGEVAMPKLLPGDTLYIGNDNKDWLNVTREWVKDIASVVPLIMLIMGM